MISPKNGKHLYRICTAKYGYKNLKMAQQSHFLKHGTHGTDQTPMALIGFRGRGVDDVVQPDFCHILVLKALIFQGP